MSLRDIAIAILIQALWGVGFTLCKPAMEAFPPLMATTIIYCIVALCLAPFAKRIRTSFIWMLVISILAGSVQTSLNLTGLHLLPATLANLLLQLTVPFAIIISWLFRDERPGLQGVLGCVVALIGVSVVIGWPDSGGSWLGIGAMAGGSLSWAIAQNLIRRHSRDDGLSLYAGMARWSIPQMLIISFLFESNQVHYLEVATFNDWLLILTLGVVAFAAGYALWYRLLSRNRIEHLLPFTLLVAPIGVAASVVFLKETLLPTLVVGGTLILCGLAVINWRRTSKPA